jgi:hypothetical protein
MADETYRRFHSGRFGPADTITPDFMMADGGQSSGNGESKKKQMTPKANKGKNDDQVDYQEDINMGRSIPGEAGE